MVYALKLSVLILFLLFSMATSHAEEALSERPQEATSFSGKPLYRYDVPAERLEKAQKQIAEIESVEDKTENDYINLGYLYVNAGQFRGAIDALTRGLNDYPKSFKLLRHRGHRYINVRELDKAIIDLEKAVKLLGKNDNDVFQYRLSGEQFGTYQHWIWYHIGIYHYLNQNYQKAIEAFEICYETSTNDDVLIGSVDWLYNTYHLNGEAKKAIAALDRIPDDIVGKKSYPYYPRLMLYKGLRKPSELIDPDKPAEEWDAFDVHNGYGLANWYKWQGDEKMAQSIYEKVLQGKFWHSWAVVLTDREQSR